MANQPFLAASSIACAVERRTSSRFRADANHGVGRMALTIDADDLNRTVGCLFPCDRFLREKIHAVRDFLCDWARGEFRSVESGEKVDENLSRLGGETILAVDRIPRPAAGAVDAVANRSQPRAAMPQQRRVRL